MNTTHPLRPTDPQLADLWDTAARVADPEIPVISIADLGILRAVRFDYTTPVITITPTYSGCPAMGTIAGEIVDECLESGYIGARVEVSLTPAWTTDWMTEVGREQLAAYGIAPPQPTAAPTGPIPIAIGTRPEVACPRCGSTDTTTLARFGSTSCKALYQCRSCHEPFDYFKAH
ncbi:phenylacetate-CoA oxygenase subunit PaaJ [Corynebacterium sp. 13CS0277]|nr:phenylacetate-CoA oxygenase subunit PaaJ [Corynebacterium sp. 13CS0277]